MGNTHDPRSFLQKGEGLRILSIKLNSPFDGQVEPFFDFIIDVIELQPQSSAKQILDKLTHEKQTHTTKRTKDFNQIIESNEERKLEVKIVSTKLRNVRSVLVTPNRNWNGKKDLIGISVRKEKYDEAFDTYFPVAEVKMHSPIHIAGVKNGEYLLGCVEFQYSSLDKFIEGLYDRFFDKEVTDKRVNLAFYDMLEDEVNIKPVVLRRDWGGQGLLGCEFMQGHVFKFPNRLKEKREQLLQQRKSYEQKAKIKEELKQCDGASKTLSQALMKRRHQQLSKHAKNIKNLIPEIPSLEAFKPEQPSEEFGQQMYQNQNYQNNSLNTSHIIQQQNARIEFLQRRVFSLEETLSSMRDYLEKIQIEEVRNEERQQEIPNTEVAK